MFGQKHLVELPVGGTPSAHRHPVPTLLVDNFAGGGGASTGIEAAAGRAVDVAINHDAEAIAMHEANHPLTRHFCQSIYSVDPLDATGGQPVLGAWFSPDCKHFSKAKGGKPVSKNIRDLAWVVQHWVKRLGPERQPRIIWLENVEEFRTWGPLGDDGRPCPHRKGETFEAWVGALRKAGYKVEWRELRACDYGTPTSRKRLFIIARCDGEPIAWPEPTHGKPGSPDVLSGKRRPWRTAAEIIDWSIRCPSIFTRKRPLKEATNRRIAAGVMRYVVTAAKPFIVPVTHSTGGNVPHDVATPLRTITTAKGGELAVAAPLFARTAHGEQDRNGKKRGQGAHPATDPYPTVTASRDSALTSATLVRQFGKSKGADVEEPAPTITAGGSGKTSLVGASLISVDNTSTRAGRSFPPEDALRTVTASGGGFAAVAAHLEKFSENSRGRPADAPIDTVMAGAPRHGVVASFLSHFYTSNTNGGRADPHEPHKTITTGGHHAVVAAHMEQANTGMVGHAATEPVSTIVGRGTTQRLVETTMVEADALPADLLDRAVRTAAFLIKYYSVGPLGHSLEQPLGSVTTKDRFAVVTVTIDAQTYVLVDIGMRMLTRRELASAQGFPPEYILDPIGPNGKPLTLTASIRMIGNSVCPQLAEAIVAANLPRVEQEKVAA